MQYNLKTYIIATDVVTCMIAIESVSCIVSTEAATCRFDHRDFLTEMVPARDSFSNNKEIERMSKHQTNLNEAVNIFCTLPEWIRKIQIYNILVLLKL